MLGEELSCLSCWKLTKGTEKGWMTLKEAGHLLRTLKFDQVFVNEKGHLIQEDLTIERFSNEFNMYLNLNRGELVEMKDPNETIIRFDCMRGIFLERGL
jgi:hypothetical protein